METIISLLNVGKMVWDCVAGSVVGWYMTCVGDSKKKAPKKRPRALSIMRPTWACGALNSAPFLSCAVRTSSVLCPHEFYDCSWNDSLVPSAFCQYPEMAMEDSQGRDQVQEGRQHSAVCLTWATRGELVQFWAHHHPGFRKTSRINQSA